MLVAVLAFEVAAPYWVCGEGLLYFAGQLEQLLESTGKKTVNRCALVGVATLLVSGATLRTHLQRHGAEYRAVRVSMTLLIFQVSAYLGLLLYLRGLTAGLTRSFLGTAGEWAIGAGLAILWVGLSIAAVVPRRHMFELTKRVTLSVVVATPVAWCAWRVGVLTTGFWKLTGGSTVSLVQFLLQPFAGAPVVRPAKFVIGTHEFRVAIAPACGGFQGIGLICVLLAVYLWLFRRSHRFPQALLLFPVGVILVWLANAVRITALILVGIWISPEIAVDGFHSQAGWIAFLIVGLGIIWVTSRMTFFTTAEVLAAEVAPGSMAQFDAAPQWIASAEGTADHCLHAPQPECTSPEIPAEPRAVIYLVPFLVLTATTMLTHAFTSGFDVLYPFRVVAVAGVLWYFGREFRWRECRVSLPAIVIGVAAFAVWMLLTPGESPQSLELSASRDPMSLGQPWATLWLLFRALGSVVTVPIAEELAFRGFLTRRLINEDVDGIPIGQFSWFSFLLSSVAFGALHGDAWLAATVVGMLFAGALYRRRQLVDAVVAHATTNALLSGYVIFTGSWSAWG